MNMVEQVTMVIANIYDLYDNHAEIVAGCLPTLAPNGLVGLHLVDGGGRPDWLQQHHQHLQHQRRRHL